MYGGMWGWGWGWGGERASFRNLGPMNKDVRKSLSDNNR